MKVEIITNNSNPYKLDKIRNYPDLAALTRKNADFIEAVVCLDSNYSIDSDNINKEGASYWFKRMLDSPDEYEECLKKSIEKIDRTNNTHLESTINGRTKMFQIIKDYCPNVNILKQAVCINPTINNYNNLFYKLCKTMLNHKGNKANNISFASKFISYARKCLNNNDVSFSKYDSVVSRKLSLYEKIYVDNSLKIVSSKYENKTNVRKELNNDIDKQNYTYEVYIRYMEAIDSILEHLKNDNGIIINKEEFDHIIWYSSKGK